MTQRSHRVPERTPACKCGRTPRLIEVRGNCDPYKAGDYFVECYPHLRTEPKRSARAALAEYRAGRVGPMPAPKVVVPPPRFAIVRPLKRASGG